MSKQTITIIDAYRAYAYFIVQVEVAK